MSTAARPQAEMAPVSRDTRPMIVGPDQPEDPYPMLLEGVVTPGFGRGARFLGIPTGMRIPSGDLLPRLHAAFLSRHRR
jgi:riboflavin kinase